MTSWPDLAEPIAWGVAGVLGALVLAAAMGGDSSAVGAGLVGLLGIAAWLAWGRQPRRMLIAGLYFLAPIDVSKGIVAPLDRFFSPGLYLTVGHVAMLMLAALWAGRRLLVERRGLPFTRLDGLALVFYGWLCIRTVGSPQGLLATATAVTYGLAVLGFYVASHVLESQADVRLALRAVVCGVAAELLLTAAQMATHSPLALPGAKVMDVSEVLTFGGAGQAFRPQGFFVHPNSLADHMTLIIPPAFALLLLGRRRLAAGVWWTALATLLAGTAMLLATMSRGGWAAAILGCGWVAWQCLRHGLLRPRHIAQMALAGVVAAVVAVAVYPQILLRLTAPDERSTESRLLLNDQAFTIIKAHPWIGVGYAGYNRAAYEYVAPAFARVSEEYQQALMQLVVHDHYLLVAAEVGLPAMVFLVFLLSRFVLLPRPWNAWEDPGAFALAAGLSGAMVAQMLFLASDNYYADIRIFMLWLTAGTLQALRLQRDARAAQRAAEPASMLPSQPVQPWREAA
jgi:O-antigen ligase